MKVLIVMGSDSDAPTLRPCVQTLRDFGVQTDVRICSAHRTPDDAAKLSKTARANGYGVIIAAAGKAAHLAGVMAAHTTLPVVGIPIKSSTMDGLDSLLSTVQMPAGIPVATVAVDGAKNAALLAVQILAVTDAALADRLEQMKADFVAQTAEKTLKSKKCLAKKPRGGLLCQLIAGVKPTPPQAWT